MSMHLRVISFLILLSCCLSAVSSSVLAQSGISRGWEYDVDAGLEDTRDILLAPLHFDGREWLFAAASLGLFFSATIIDEELRGHAHSPSWQGWDIPLTAGDLYGNARVSAALGAGTYAVGALAGDAHTRVTGRMLLQSVVYSSIVMHGMKIISGRARPGEEEGNTAFHLFRFEDRYFSFPSGHAMVAFAVSTTLSRRIGSVPVTILLYGLSGLTVLQRLAHDRHWFSDTVVGALIGGAIGFAVVRAEERRASETAVGAAGHESVVRHVPLFQWGVAF